MSKRTTHTEAERVRHKLAEAYRKEALKDRWKKKERAAFNQMADAWERTLQKTPKR